VARDGRPSAQGERRNSVSRKTYDRELQRLQDEVLSLGDIVEKATVEAVNALMERDSSASNRLIAADRAINERRFAIEGDALTLIATQQPLAGDLRTIFAVVEIANELERIADYAKGIAKVNLMMDEEPLLGPCRHLPAMAGTVRDMLHRALEAFVRQDSNLALSVSDWEHQVDELHNRVYRELLAVITSDPNTTENATSLLWVGHNLERGADRVLNICERVVFNVTGEIMEMDAEEGEYLGLHGLS
jgi:phosphate transport system protein